MKTKNYANTNKLGYRDQRRHLSNRLFVKFLLINSTNFYKQLLVAFLILYYKCD